MAAPIHPPIHPLILSGGSGSRLWPVSRSSHPKQFLALGEHKPMIAATALRVAEAHGFAAPVIISNTDHRFLVMDALSQAGVKPSATLLEPCGRNTAAAIAVGALQLSKTQPDALMLAMPSDHVIRDEAGFRAAIAQAAPLAEAGHIVTFGVIPSRPDVGYGYIQQGEALEHDATRIARFAEKPDAATAQSYIDEGNYLWNAGLFLFKASAVLEELRSHCPDIYAGAQKALEAAQTDMDFTRLDEAAFAATPSQPFDIAVMEQTDKGAVLPIDIGWSDVGSWDALWDVLEKDANGNAAQGDALFAETKNSLSWSTDGRLNALVGVEDVVLVTTDDAVLVAHKDKAPLVKDVVERLKREGRSEHAISPTVYRPWGNYRTIDEGEGYLTKRIEVKPGAKLSLQYHHHRAEHWVVVRGVATVTRGEDVFDLQPNESTYIPLGVTHRLENKTGQTLAIIEVQSGEHISEEDIVRVEDTYGRAKQA